MFWILYLISIADNLKVFLGTIGGIGLAIYCLLLIIFSIAWGMNVDIGNSNLAEAFKKTFFKLSKKIYLGIIAIIFLLGCVFIPSSKNLIIIFGITKFSQSKIYEQTNEVAQKSLQLLNKKLDGYLKEKNE